MNDQPRPGFWEIGTGLAPEEFDDIFVELHDKVSDIFLQVDQPIRVRYQGRIVSVTDDPLNKSIVSELLDHMATTPRAAEIMKGYPDGWTHPVLVKNDTVAYERGDRLRFRCNARSVHTLDEAEAIHMTMRPIELEPRDIRTLGLPDPLLSGLFPQNGIVLFSGPTGSGKTTTMAACMREVCYDPMGKVIITTEDPLEQNLHVLENTTAVIVHSELGRNVAELNLSMRASLRENPDVIVTGEMRDEETMMLAVEGSQTGHTMYSTIHCNSVTNVFGRVAQKIINAKAEDVVNAFIESARCFVYQRLFPGIDGKRVLVLEYVIITGEDRRRLKVALGAGGLAGVSNEMMGVLERNGQSFVDSAKAHLEHGRFTQEQYDQIVRDFELEAAVERGEIKEFDNA